MTQPSAGKKWVLYYYSCFWFFQFQTLEGPNFYANKGYAKKRKISGWCMSRKALPNKKYIGLPKTKSIPGTNSKPYLPGLLRHPLPWRPK